MPPLADVVDFPRTMVAACGTYPNAVAAVQAFSRTIWAVFIEHSLERRHRRLPYWSVDAETLTSTLTSSLRPFVDDPQSFVRAILNRLTDAQLARQESDRTIGLLPSAMQPTRVARECLGSLRPDHDLRFFIARAIRRHYRCVLSSRMADQFQQLSRAANLLAGGDLDRYRKNLDYFDDFLQPLRSALQPQFVPEEDSGPTLSLFIECCRTVNYLQPSFAVRKINLIARIFDADFLISRLFGTPTGIVGFDELFGGGGLMLVDDIEPDLPAQIRGRSVLVHGRYATGKSLLALEMAVAVATKGGIAWVMPLEQSAEECLYALRSMCRLPNDGSVVVASDPMSARDYLSSREMDRGAIIFLRTIKESFDHFVDTFEANVAAMHLYPMRFIVVDPVTALQRNDTLHANRAAMLRLFEQAKNAGTNVCLIAEEGSEFGEDSVFEQNISDTVIHLSLKERYGDVQRYLEITKSRLQREQRGKHPYRILPGTGIEVYPSAAAVADRIASRRLRQPDAPIEFGFAALDEVLGRGSICAGDIIVIDGAAGTLKSQLGLMFVLSASTRLRGDREELLSKTAPTRNLIVAARDDETSVEALLRQAPFSAAAAAFRSGGHLKVRSLRSGFVQPGYILQRVERELLDARLAGDRLDRVMIDDVGHWEMSCPYVREDETFGDTLIDLLRRYRVTSVLSCSTAAVPRGGSLQQAILDGADCVIKLERIQFRGADRIILRILKTRGMQHKRETFEVAITKYALELRPTSSLLRVRDDGTVDQVPITLMLHAESIMQEAYNQDVLSTVRTVLSRQASLQPPRKTYIDDALALTSLSSSDEMQLIQLDEFKAPRSGVADHGLRRFAMTELEEFRNGDYPGRFHVEDGDGQFAALPLYANVGMFAYRGDLVRPEALLSWEALSAECQAWEAENAEVPGVFFDFPGGQENYNCLFLEILLTLASPPSEVRGCRLREWLAGSVCVQAAELVRKLCRRSHLARAARLDSQSSLPQRLNAMALVWRTWYSTLNQLMAELPWLNRSAIGVTQLPQGVSIAGEWYLAAPAHSAAPDVALNLMKLLTSRDAELERMKRGVGLPTRLSFYRSKQAHLKSYVSPFFAMNIDVIGQILENAFPRSCLGCYGQAAGVLSSHLQAIIELSDEAAADGGIELILERLGEEIGFVLNNIGCRERGTCSVPAAYTF